MYDLKPWHEQDVFWEHAQPLLFGQRRLSDTPAEVDKIISLLGLHPSMNVLDLCCGIGRHSLEFAHRGFHVTAVDRTGLYLNKASQQAAAEGLNIEFIQDNMRTFCRPGAFERVVNLFTSFGYFEDPDEDRKVLTNVFRSLKPGGVLLMDMMGKEVLARIFQEKNWYEEDGILILEERKLSNGWGWIDTRWVLLQGSDHTEVKLSLRLYSAAELTSLLTGCGFSHVEVHGDFEGSAYDHTAKRLVVVAHK